MTTLFHLHLAEVEQRICDLASDNLGIPRHRVSPQSSLVEDLGVDSLDLVELFMDIEKAFGVTLPEDSPCPVYKAVFTRLPFRLRDLAELVYLQQGTGTPTRTRWMRKRSSTTPLVPLPFTQLDGRWERSARDGSPLLEPLPSRGTVTEYRRRSDGMRCVLLPGATVEIGCDDPHTPRDEKPLHRAELSPFLIDAEPVSTTAYCRFLNSIGPTAHGYLADLFVLDPQDDRNEQALVRPSEGEWRPLPGTERWPMILVSWYGANAYSLWANGKDWTNYRDEGRDESGSFLPTEAQWEYAARGPRHQLFPWGDSPPSGERMRYSQHERGVTYHAEEMPMAEVNEPLGVSPFGLRHMAGNVWQWCRDWYDPSFYLRPEAKQTDPLHRTPTGVRSERGGSWVGPSELCRSSFRRGRPPLARGRCLGFRCVSRV